MKSINTKNLGRTQRYVLRYSLGDRNRNGIWHPGCGWNYGTISQTRRIMETLAKRGLVDTRKINLSPGHETTEYTLNDAGRAAIREVC